MASDHKSNTEFEIQYEPPGRWTVRVGTADVVATAPVRERGHVKATLHVYRDDNPLTSDIVNLTRERARRRWAAQVQTEFGITIPTQLLVCLEEAIRRVPRSEYREKKCAPVGGNISDGPPQSYEDLYALVKQRLLLNDPDVLPVLLAACAAHRLSGDPVWLMLVGPSSGAKTQLLTMLSDVPGVFPLSELTPRTLASGLTKGQDDPSLLARLTNEVLVFKDFTSVLSLNSDDRSEILAQLREIYDGRYDKVWGTGKELHWTGRLGFLAGVTPVIDRHYGVIAVLGQRFLLFRLNQPGRLAVARRAIDNTDLGRDAWKSLQAATAAFIASLPEAEPDLPPDLRQWIAGIADLTAHARSAVERDGYKHELNYAPEPEMPGRLARQFTSLAKGLALVAKRTEVTTGDVQRVARVALDCLPAVRALLIRTLYKHDEDLTTTALATQVQYSTSTLRRALEDLQALGLVVCEKGGAGKADKWSLCGEYKLRLRDNFGKALDFPTSEPDSDSSPQTEAVEEAAASGPHGSPAHPTAADHRESNLPDEEQPTPLREAAPAPSVDQESNEAVDSDEADDHSQADPRIDATIRAALRKAGFEDFEIDVMPPEAIDPWCQPRPPAGPQPGDRRAAQPCVNATPTGDDGSERAGSQASHRLSDADTAELFARLGTLSGED